MSRKIPISELKFDPGPDDDLDLEGVYETPDPYEGFDPAKVRYLGGAIAAGYAVTFPASAVLHPRDAERIAIPVLRSLAKWEASRG